MVVAGASVRSARGGYQRSVCLYRLPWDHARHGWIGEVAHFGVSFVIVSAFFAGAVHLPGARPASEGSMALYRRRYARARRYTRARRAGDAGAAARRTPKAFAGGGHRLGPGTGRFI